MRGLLLIIAFLASLAGVVGAMQFLPMVAQASAAVVAHEAARAARDVDAVLGITTGPVIETHASARDHAFDSSEETVRSLPAFEQLLVLGMRAAVLDGRLGRDDLRDSSGLDLVRATMTAAARTMPEPQAPLQVLQPVLAVPSGTDSVVVWLGPHGFGTAEMLPLAVIGRLFYRVERIGDEWRVDPLGMLERSAQENVRLINGGTHRLSDRAVSILTGYKGDIAALWKPLGRA